MIAWTVERYEVVDSTQDVARENLKAGRVIVAGWQRAGRGRHGRAWTAPPGTALLCSAVVSPPEPVVPILPLLAGVAVHDAIGVAAAVRPDLKWPNDVLAGGRKLAGILVEHPPGRYAVVGIGINANMGAADLPGGSSTSLLVLTGQTVNLDALLARVLDQLAGWLTRAERGRVIAQAFRERTSMLGRPVQVVVADRVLHGIAEDITEAGALLLRHPDGRLQPLIAGEVVRVQSQP